MRRVTEPKIDHKFHHTYYSDCGFRKERRLENYVIIIVDDFQHEYKLAWLLTFLEVSLTT